MNADGTYNIPILNMSSISPEQVEEFKVNTAQYSRLGLSQFIPQMTTLTSEMRRAGIDTSLDGKTGTMEQQQVLRFLYTRMFGKISSQLMSTK